jgi:hypothetical protein
MEQTAESAIQCNAINEENCAIQEWLVRGVMVSRPLSL